jgi:hypothetical protein
MTRTAAFLTLFASAAFCAQTAPLNSQGAGQAPVPAVAVQSEEWIGVRTTGGRSQAIVLNLDKTGGGHGTIDLPDFGAINIPAAKFEMTKTTVHFELVGDTSDAIFDGIVSTSEIHGHWTEGNRSGDFILHPSNKHNSGNALLKKNLVVQNGDVRLSGTLVMPHASGPVPLIVFVHGAGPETRVASLFLADYFAKRGIAAFAYDKRGAGESTGDWKHASFETLAGDVEAVVKFLEHVSKMPPERDPEAGQVKEGVVDGEQMFMTNQQAAKLSEPRIGSLHYPPAFVAAEFAAVFIAPSLVVLPVGRNQFDATLFEPLAQRIGIITTIGYDALRFLPRSASWTWDADFCDRGLRKLNFTRGGTFQPNSHRKTFTVDQYHPLRALAALGFADCGAPFFAGAKLPSRKVSSHLSSPRSSSVPSNVRHASSQTPFSCHLCNRRQQVEGDGNSSGRNRHAAPVCRTHSMPSKQARFGAGGRPRLSRRCLGLGSKGSINFHCSSVNSFCRFFMTEAQQLNHRTRKCLI